MRSLRSRLFVLWTLSLLASLAVGVLLLALYQQSSAAQLDRAEAEAVRTCDDIADRFTYYAAGWAGPVVTDPAGADPADDPGLRADLQSVADLALSQHPRFSGGIWQQDRGALATAPLATPPAAPDIGATLAALVADALSEDRGAAAHLLDGAGTVLLQACPLRGPLPNLAAFAVTQIAAAPGQRLLWLGLAVLMSLALAMTFLLSWLVLAWQRRIVGIETALAAHAAGALPRLPPTGERELDRIVDALNLAGTRLSEARLQSEALAARVALSERLAALGRVAAGVAHEIRNPIAAMRLRAENALAGDEARRHTALEAILAQIARLDRLLTELLAMTQRRDPAPEPTDLAALLEACAADHRQADGPRISATAPAGRFLLDPALLRRALDNLVQNAVRHTPKAGSVTLAATQTTAGIEIAVTDTGPGVPKALHASLFEPFVTGRADGTGLGLAIARELVQAQGGTLTLGETGSGASFILTLPAKPCA